MKKIFVLFMLSLPLYQATIYTEQTSISSIPSSIDCSSIGIKQFLIEVYNLPEYGHDFLPNNFSHMIQLLEHGRRNVQSKSYVKSVLRLFNNKLKSTNYINAYAFNQLLAELPSLLQNSFVVYRTHGIFDKLKEEIYKTLFQSIKIHFDEFKTKPRFFLDRVSQEIVDLFDNHKEQEATEEEVRKTILVFLEMSLNKLVWSPHDGYDTWELVKDISCNLTQLVDYRIFDDQDDLNDLFITLIERYCYFLDITSTELPIDFHQKIKNDIESNPLALLTLEEQEEYITSKLSILKRGLMLADKRAADSAALL